MHQYLVSSVGSETQKPLKARWLTLLLHFSQPMSSSDFRLGKQKWKESKKRMSDGCSPCFNKVSNWSRKTKNCVLKWLRGIAHRVVIPSLSRLRWDEISHRYIEPSYQVNEKDLSISSSPTWPELLYPLIDRSQLVETASFVRGKWKGGRKWGLSHPMLWKPIWDLRIKKF